MIVLNGSGLSIEKLVRIARFNEPVSLAPEALERIRICRAMLEEKLAGTAGLAAIHASSNA